MRRPFFWLAPQQDAGAAMPGGHERTLMRLTPTSGLSHPHILLGTLGRVLPEG